MRAPVAYNMALLAKVCRTLGYEPRDVLRIEVLPQQITVECVDPEDRRHRITYLHKVKGWA